MRKGYPATTISDIVRDAGVTQGTFYLYFENKADIFSALLREYRELLIADLFVHRDLAFELPPEALLYSCLFSGVDAPWPARDTDRMPLTEQVHDLGRPASAATPHVPRYPQMLEVVYDRLGREARDFRGYRLLMPYPPIPSALVLRYGLAERVG